MVDQGEFTSDIAPIYIGLPYSQTFTYLDANGGTVALSGYTGRLNIVSSDHEGGSAIIALTTANGRMTLGTVAPNIVCSISDADTTALHEAQAYAFLTLTSGGGTDEPLLWGPVQIRYWGAP